MCRGGGEEAGSGVTLVVLDRDTLLSIFNGALTPAQALQTGQVRGGYDDNLGRLYNLY